MSKTESAGRGTRKIRTEASLLLAAALILTLPACGLDTERGKIKSLKAALNQRTEDLSRGEAGAYLSFFAPDYKDQWLSLDQARLKADERFQRSPLPRIRFGDHEFVIEGDRAVVKEEFAFEDSVAGRTVRRQEIQHLIMERRGDRWVCISGSEVLKLLSGRLEEEQAIEQAMLQRENALVRRDLSAYMNLVSPRYLHKGVNREELRKIVLKNLQAYSNLEFKSFDRKIHFHGEFATVEQRFNLQAEKIGGKIETFSGPERFELEKTPEGWKFIRGLN